MPRPTTGRPRGRPPTRGHSTPLEAATVRRRRRVNQCDELSQFRVQHYRAAQSNGRQERLNAHRQQLVQDSNFVSSHYLLHPHENMSVRRQLDKPPKTYGSSARRQLHKLSNTYCSASEVQTHNVGDMDKVGVDCSAKLLVGEFSDNTATTDHRKRREDQSDEQRQPQLQQYREAQSNSRQDRFNAHQQQLVQDNNFMSPPYQLYPHENMSVIRQLDKSPKTYCSSARRQPHKLPKKYCSASEVQTHSVSDMDKVSVHGPAKLFAGEFTDNTATTDRRRRRVKQSDEQRPSQLQQYRERAQSNRRQNRLNVHRQLLAQINNIVSPPSLLDPHQNISVRRQLDKLPKTYCYSARKQLHKLPKTYCSASEVQKHSVSDMDKVGVHWSAKWFAGEFSDNTATASCHKEKDTSVLAASETTGNVEDADSQVAIGFAEDELPKSTAEELNPLAAKKKKIEWQGDELERRLDEAYNILQSSLQDAKRKKDGFYIFGKLVAAKLRRMDEETSDIAMNKIHNTMFDLKLNLPSQSTPTDVYTAAPSSPSTSSQQLVPLFHQVFLPSSIK